MDIKMNPGRGYIMRVKPKDGYSHRYFLDKNGDWLICDNSGNYPEDTEDGRLYIDISKPADCEGFVDVDYWANLCGGFRSPIAEEDYEWLTSGQPQELAQKYSPYELGGAL